MVATMSKKPQNRPMSIVEQVSETLASKPIAPIAATPAKVVEPVGDSVKIDVPYELKEMPTFRLHVDLSVSGRQAKAARLAAAGLDRDRAELESGKRCVGTNDLVRWILERLADQLGIE